MVRISLNSTVPLLKICCHSVAMVCNKTTNLCSLFDYGVVVCYFSGSVLKTVVGFHTAHHACNRYMFRVACSLEMFYSCFSGLWAHSWWPSLVVSNRNHARTWLVSVFYNTNDKRTEFWLVLARVFFVNEQHYYDRRPVKDFCRLRLFVKITEGSRR